MLAEFGLAALWLAAALAALQIYAGLVGWRQPDGPVAALVKPVAVAQAALVTTAFLSLIALFLRTDLSVRLVVMNSHAAKPWLYKFAGTWGNHEGSMLLWVTVLAVAGAMVALLEKRLEPKTLVATLGAQALIGLGFYGFLLIASNPFARQLPAASEGQGLNPLLQDPGLAFHPPTLYFGYVGISIAFAFAVGALITRDVGPAFARAMRPWVLISWIFLTVGIVAGSYWAYYELGWGGWWFWDPVENASFLPWLVSTALIHSLAVTEKRGLFRSWTIMLSLIAFSLSLLGTFLVRSGVLTSVHAFATDPKRGVFILLFLAVVVGGSLALFAARSGKVRSGGSFSLVSRETFLLVNNVLLTTAAAAVLLGTLYPLIIDALNLGKLSVGPPYFNAVFAPIMTPVLLFMVIGSYARWKNDSVANLTQKLRPIAIVSVLLGCSAPLLAGEWSALVAMGLSLSIWIVLASFVQIYRQLKDTANWKSTPISYWGMHMAHIGIAVCVVGITMVKGYETEKDVRMTIGDTVSVGGYTLRLTGIDQVPGPNYNADRGNVELIKGDKVLRVLHPEKRTYFSSTMPMTEAAIDSGPTRDVYVSLGERLEGEGTPAWAMRVYHKPFITWIWLGCFLMAIGGGMAALDKRYRKKLAAKLHLNNMKGAVA